MSDRTGYLTRHDLEAKLVKRCWEDEAFRKEFTADPAGAFVKYLNAPASSLPKIIIHQEEPGAWHIVLPAKPVNTRELSEEELEKISGGPIVIVPITAVVSVIVSAASVSGVSASAVASVVEGGW